MPVEAKTRVDYLDLLKVIGLTVIINAHVGPPSWLLMLGSFDVPLMVILSAILADRSYKKYEGQGTKAIIRYYISRFCRLVIPTWIFLTLYFVLNIILKGKTETISYYIFSYCLTRYGIGYVWIMLIYLYSALLVPLFSKIKFSVKGAIIVVATYVLYEVVYATIGTGGGIAGKLIDTAIYIIPYGLLTYLGFNYHRMTQKLKYAIIIITAFITLVITGGIYWCWEGAPQLVQNAKYPPRLYFLSYGVFCSFVLLKICESKKIRVIQNRFITWIATHSMWIYLWHILALLGYSTIGLPEIWYIKLIVVYAFAMVAVVIVNKILDIVERNRKISCLKFLRG